MPTIAQRLKASGNLTQVSLADINSVDVALSDLDFVVENNFCGHPHNVDPDIIASDPDTVSQALDLPRDYCEELIRGMQKMDLAATGSGAYPPNCNPLYPGVHSAAYYDDPAIWPSHLNRTLTDSEFQGIIDSRVWGPSGDHNGTPFTMTELKSVWGNSPLNQVVNDFAEETYRRIGLILYPVFTGESGQHNIHVTYPVIAGGVIGVGWFPGNDPCPGDHVNLHIDRTYTSGFQGQFGLKIHELGHTVQLQHQFSGQGSHQEPMSYSYSNHLVVGYSNGDAVFKLPKAPSLSVLTRLYGGVPVGIPWKGKFSTPIPDPNPDPVPSQILLKPVLTGKDSKGRVIILNEFDYSGRTFVVAPKLTI